MDGLRSEEVRRQRTAILKFFGLSEKSDPKKVRYNFMPLKLHCLLGRPNQGTIDKGEGTVPFDFIYVAYFVRMKNIF